MTKNSSFDVVHRRRLQALRDLLREKKLETYLVMHFPDLFYLTGFRSEGYSDLIGLKEAWLFLPKLLFQHGQEATQGFHCLQGPFWKLLERTIKVNKLKKIGFDPETTPYQLGLSLSQKGYKGVGGLLSQLRIIKDREELAALRKACHLAYEGYLFAKSRAKPGVRESTISIDLEHFFRKKGANGVAFETIIGAGSHSAYPHHVTSNDRIKRGEPVVMDL